MIEVRCIVVDIDDTLYLERDYVRSGLRYVALWLERTESISGFFDAAWTEFEAGKRGSIFDKALKRLGRPSSPSLIDEMVNTYREHVPEIRMEPDAAAFVASLPPTAAVVSDGPLRSQQRKCAALGIDGHIGLVVLTAAYGEGFYKPSTRPFSYVSEHFHVCPEACVYVADNPAKDFEGPKALGWHTVRIRRPEGLHAWIPSGGDVDVEIPTFEQFGEGARIIL